MGLGARLPGLTSWFWCYWFCDLGQDSPFLSGPSSSFTRGIATWKGCWEDQPRGCMETLPAQCMAHSRCSAQCVAHSGCSANTGHFSSTPRLSLSLSQPPHPVPPRTELRFPLRVEPMAGSVFPDARSGLRAFPNPLLAGRRRALLLNGKTSVLELVRKSKRGSH